MPTGIRVLTAQCCMPSRSWQRGWGRMRCSCILLCLLALPAWECCPGHSQRKTSKGMWAGRTAGWPSAKGCCGRGSVIPPHLKLSRKAFGQHRYWNQGYSANQIQKLNPRRALQEERGDHSNFTPQDEWSAESQWAASKQQKNTTFSFSQLIILRCY